MQMAIAAKVTPISVAASEARGRLAKGTALGLGTAKLAYCMRVMASTATATAAKFPSSEVGATGAPTTTSTHTRVASMNTMTNRYKSACMATSPRRMALPRPTTANETMVPKIKKRSPRVNPAR